MHQTNFVFGLFTLISHLVSLSLVLIAPGIVVLLLIVRLCFVPLCLPVLPLLLLSLDTIYDWQPGMDLKMEL